MLRRALVGTTLVGLALASVLAAPAPATEAAGAGGLPLLQERIERADGQLQGASSELQRVEQDARRARADLAAATAALTAAEEALADLEDRRIFLEAAHEEARAELDVASNDLQTGMRRLHRAVDQRDADAGRLGEQIAGAYRHGSGMPINGMAAVLTHAGDISEFVTAMDVLRLGAHRQSDLVGRATVHAEELARQEAALGERQEQGRAEEARARAARAEIEALTARQRELVAVSAQQRAERQRLLAAVEQEQASYAELVEALERDSATLTEELRRYRFVAGAPRVPGGAFVWPTDGRATSGFGSRRHPIFGDVRLHAGMDIPAPAGQPIVAAGDGRVVHAGPRGGYGQAVVIDHGGGLASLYAHQAARVVRAGEGVKAGQRIGLVGSTGQSTGPHLHFEVRVDGDPQDPMAWFAGEE